MFVFPHEIPSSRLSLGHSTKVQLLRVASGSVENPNQVNCYTLSFPHLIVQDVESFHDWDEAQEFAAQNCYIDCHTVGRYWPGQHVKIPALGLTN